MEENRGYSSFTMDHVKEILTIQDHTVAKARAIEILNQSTANQKNKTQMTKMIKCSRDVSHLALGMSNHILAHPAEGLKVLK